MKEPDFVGDKIPVTQSEMTHEERLLWLAEAKVTCHHDKVQAWDVPEAIRHCPDCGGTDTVFRFPTLRGKCPGRSWLGGFQGCPVPINIITQEFKAKCKCEGRGYELVDNLEATRKAAIEDSLVFKLITFPTSGITEVVVVGLPGDNRFGKAEHKIANEAAVSALYQAMQKEEKP